MGDTSVARAAILRLLPSYCPVSDEITTGADTLSSPLLYRCVFLQPPVAYYPYDVWFPVTSPRYSRLPVTLTRFLLVFSDVTAVLCLVSSDVTAVLCLIPSDVTAVFCLVSSDVTGG